jgi:hypothetical protein
MGDDVDFQVILPKHVNKTIWPVSSLVGVYLKPYS